MWAGDQKDNKQRMERNQVEAEVVVHIFDLYVYKGQSCRRVGLTLDAEGILSPTGKTSWNESTVRRILSDPTYTGKGGGYKYVSTKEKGRYSSKLKDPSEWLSLPEGTFPQIIDEETFNKAQEKLELNKVDASRNNPEPKATLLRCGFVRCGYCKRIMCVTQNIGANYNPERHKPGYSYKCGWKYRGNSRCERACSMAVDELDTIVWDYVGEILEDFTLVEQAVKLASSNNSAKADLLSVNRSLKNAKEAQDEFIADLKEINSDGMLKLRGRGKDLVLDQIDQLQQRIDELEETRLEIEKGKDNWKQIDEEINKFLEWVLASKDMYKTATYEEKRRALRMLGITVVVYSKSDPDHPERYEIKLKVPDIVRHTV